MFGYDQALGRLTKNGKPIGWMSATGYRYVTVGKTHYKEHRLIWLRETGAWPVGQLDHIDNDRANNRISNLRDVTGSENQWNTGLNKSNTSGYRGVAFHKGAGRYIAKIKRGGKQIHLGYFDTAEEAAKAYAAARSVLHI